MRMRTTARRDGGDWILRPEEFITNALSGEVFVTVAKTVPHAKGAKGLSLSWWRRAAMTPPAAQDSAQNRLARLRHEQFSSTKPTSTGEPAGGGGKEVSL